VADDRHEYSSAFTEPGPLLRLDQNEALAECPQ